MIIPGSPRVVGVAASEGSAMVEVPSPDADPLWLRAEVRPGENAAYQWVQASP
jgi:hypothetical protein